MNRIIHINLFFLASSLLFSSCNEDSAPTQEAAQEQTEEHGEENLDTAELTEEQYRMAGIALGKPEMRNLSSILTVTGELDLPPQNMASVSAPLGGFVKSTDLLEGMQVKKGQLIARIENPEFVTLQQDYLEARSRLDYLELEYKRQQELSEEQVTSAKTFQQTTAEYKAVRAQVEALAERLRIIGINPTSLREGKISRILPIYSPIGGFVTYINANIGQYVNPTDVLFRIADTDHLHVELTVFEKDVAALQKGQKVHYALPGEGVAKHEASIYLIGKEISSDRTVQVHAHMEEEDKDLVPGMYVQALVELDGNTVPALPQEAIVQSEGKDYIFFYKGARKEEGKQMRDFKMVEVRKGVTESGYTELLQPADTTNMIVVKGAYALLSKMKNSEEGHGH